MFYVIWYKVELHRFRHKICTLFWLLRAHRKSQSPRRSIEQTRFWFLSFCFVLKFLWRISVLDKLLQFQCLPFGNKTFFLSYKHLIEVNVLLIELNRMKFILMFCNKSCIRSAAECEFVNQPVRINNRQTMHFYDF